MENVFNQAPTGEETAVTAEVSTTSNELKKQKIAKMREAMRETITTDPDFIHRLRTLSNSIEVVNSLGFGDYGNIVVDKANSTKEKRELNVTSKIVGYRIANIGTEPVQYVTETWAQDETGKYVPTKTQKALAPGGTADLTRQYMAMFAAMPEISFQMANGRLTKGSSSRGDKSLKAELESYHFSFNKDENGVKKQVNDDDVKLNVGEKIGDKWVVKPEFVETFGYLNNPKETEKGGRKSSGEKFNAQDLAANYVFRMIQENNL